MLIASCGKNATDVQVSTPESFFTIKATAEENTVTKGTFDNKGAFTWSDGDKIVAYRIENNTYKWHESMNLVSGAGQPEGTFRASNGDVVEGKKFSIVAFYPNLNPNSDYNTGIDDYSNYSADQNNLYFHLLPEMTYKAGLHPLPLATAINEPQAGNKDLKVLFSQVGAGVKVSLNNVPAKANKISLTVAGKNITGWFSVSVPSIGTDNGFISNASQGDGSTVAYTFATASASRNMEFIFPMPTTALPSLELNLYIEGETLPVWSATTPAQPTLGRGDLLDMPKLALAEPYYIYLLDESTYYKLYVYGDAGEIFGGWPGKVSDGTETISGNQWCHRFSVPAKYKGKTINIIFSGDNGQTGDITNVTLGDNHYLYFKKNGEQVSF